MRKTCVIILAVFSLSLYLTQTIANDKIDLKLEDQIGIVFINKNILLIMSEEEATLLALEKDKIDNIKKFNYKNLNLLTLNNDYINVDSKTKIILDNEYEAGNVKYTLRNGLIYINYKNTNMCIYMGGEYNITDCQFVYFHNNKTLKPTICDYNEIILYYYRKPLPTSFLEEIYDQGIDTYQLRDDELTIIKLSAEDYDFIVIDNE